MSDTRSKWRSSYRMMRIILSSNPQNHSKLCRFDGLDYRAYCVLEFHRNQPNKWDTPIKDRLEQEKLAEEIINEILGEES